MILRFGMHRGKYISDVPSSYLEWLLRECDNLDWLLERRSRKNWPAAAAGNVRHRHRRSITRRSIGATVIRSWHRELAMRFHPDRGGSVAAMQAVNVAADRLK